jgi:ubiquinone/menaquinone biosynthesis C-methylase UbiE
MREAMPYPLTGAADSCSNISDKMLQMMEGRPRARGHKISLKNGFAENLKLPANKIFYN